MLQKFVVVAAACVAASLAPAQGAAGRAPKPQSQDRSELQRQIQELRDDIRRLHAELSRLQEQDAESEAKEATKEKAQTKTKAMAEAKEQGKEKENAEAKDKRPRVWTLGGDGDGLSVVVGGEDGEPTLLKTRDGKLLKAWAASKDGQPRVWTLGGDEGLSVIIGGEDGEPTLLRVKDGKLLETKEAVKEKVKEKAKEKAQDKQPRVRSYSTDGTQQPVEVESTPITVQGCTCNCPCCQAHRAGAVVTAPRVKGTGGQSKLGTALRSLLDRTVPSKVEVQRVHVNPQIDVIEVPRVHVNPQIDVIEVPRTVPVTPKTPKASRVKVIEPVQTKVETGKTKRQISI